MELRKLGKNGDFWKYKSGISFSELYSSTRYEAIIHIYRHYKYGDRYIQKNIAHPKLFMTSRYQEGESYYFCYQFPQIWIRESLAQHNFCNNTGNSRKIKLGFNYPQTGPYADEGADEFRAYELAVKHLNGEGDGGMLNTTKPSLLKGNGILG